MTYTAELAATTDHAKTKRPEMGQRVIVKAKVVRRRFYSERTSSGKTPRRWIRAEIKPITGIYIGYRTKYDGLAWWEDDEVGTVFVPTANREVWLIVSGTRLNPIPALPEDVEVIYGHV